MARLGRRRWQIWGMVAALAVAWLPAPSGFASVNTCHVFYAPDTVRPSASSSYTFNVSNGMLTPMRTIMIAPPGDAVLTLESASSPGFTADVSESGVVLYGGEVAPGGSANVTVQASVGASLGIVGPWSVAISDDNDLSVTCSGDMNVVVDAATQGVRISGIAVTNVVQTAVTVVWNTDVPSTSQVAYGATAAYNHRSVLDSRLAINHRVTLTGLSSDTSYHFMVVSTVPAAGDTNSSLDNTFVTATVPPPAMAPAVVTVASVSKEAVSPAVRLAHILAAPVTEMPLVTGTASDNVAVVKVEYSVDDGITWRPVDGLVPAQGAASVSYSFRPTVTDDGEYAIRVRATDSSGNMTVSGAERVILDRLPPRFGTQELRLGSQPLVPDAAGHWQLVAGVDASLWLNAVGGPVQAVVMARRNGLAGAASQQFSLHKDAETGLWGGVLALGTAGLYDISVVADDGASNHTVAQLGQILVVRPGRVTADAPARPVSGAEVTVYYRAVDTHQWLVWDGSGYGQRNPVKVGAAGAVSFMVPAGTYYAEVRAPGYRTQMSSQFHVTQAQVINPLFHLASWPAWSVGRWRLALPVWPQLADSAVAPVHESQVMNSLRGRHFPDFQLPLADGGTLSRVQLLGRPSVVSVMATWSRMTSEQQQALEAIGQSGKVRMVTIVPGERASRVRAFRSGGQYQMTAVIDERIDMGSSLGVLPVPTHFVLDRQGVVRSVFYGLVTQSQLTQATEGL